MHTENLECGYLGVTFVGFDSICGVVGVLYEE